MRTRLRRKLDETEESYWTDAELTDYINESYYYYWQWLLNARDNRALKSTTLDIVAGTAEIAVPSDYISARLIEKVEDNSTCPIQWFERFDEPNYTGGSSYSNYYPNFTARFVGTDLVLEPTPNTSETGGIKLTYYFYPAELSDDSDTPVAGFSPIYHDLIPFKAAVISKTKEESYGGGAPVGSWEYICQQKEKEFKASIELPSTQRVSVKPFYA
jgi:hypothetical protein